MSDYLVKCLWKGVADVDQQEDAADRIEELEAKLANAKYFLEMHPAYIDKDCRVLIKKALARLKGDKP
jgi:hypothetical protein